MANSRWELPMLLPEGLGENDAKQRAIGVHGYMLSLAKYLVKSYTGAPVDRAGECVFCGATRMAACEHPVTPHDDDCPWPALEKVYIDETGLTP